eukprot:12035191-Prorocentrum_lima.AAC.1
MGQLAQASWYGVLGVLGGTNVRWFLCFSTANCTLMFALRAQGDGCERPLDNASGRGQWSRRRGWG